MKKSKFDIKTICMIGIMAALVFVGTNLRIKIPVGNDGTMLHLGNVFCLLGGLLFGGLPGGLAAGFGSALFDLFSEYASEAWITFITKFAMGFVAGFVAHIGIKKSESKIKVIIGAILGSITYCVLYIFKTIIMQRFVYGLLWEGVLGVVAVKGVVTFTNGIIAVVASLLLYYALKPAMKRAGVV